MGRFSLSAVAGQAYFALGAALAGCDASGSGLGGIGDGAADGKAPNETDSGASADGSVVDAGADGRVPSAPVTKRLVTGSAKLVGDWLASCTNQVPASGNGDRWCAFIRPGALLGKSELWVINVTKAKDG